MPQHNEIESGIKKLALTIKELMPLSRGGWVKWRKAAKAQEGSELFEPQLSGLAQLPKYKHLFHATGKVVRLSNEGICFANSLRAEKLTEVQQIAYAVIQYAARLKRIDLKIQHIFKVARAGSKFVQAIYVDLADEIIPSETPVEFRPQNGSMTQGRIVGQEPDGGVLYVAFDNEVLESSLPAILSVDRGYLLRELAERIRILPQLPPLIQPMIHNDWSVKISLTDDDSVDLARALSELQTPWTRFLWGPPGAGKTYGLGHLITRLIRTESQARILIVAPSNRSVDVAVEQLVTQLEKSEFRQLIEQRKILRFGYPRKTRIIERPELLGPPELDELNNKVKQLSLQITKVEREENSSARIAVLRAEILAVQEEVKRAVAAHIRNSQVVATTTTLAYLSSSPISNEKWNTVLVDEVTMVTPAMCTFLASLSIKRLLLAGDPRQLGPVYENGPNATSDEFEWMGRDIFEKCGIVINREMEKQRKINIDARLARITSQRRCAQEIWSKVKYLYPEVKNLADEKQLQKITDLPPCPGHSVVLLNTAQLAVCKKVNNSWKNDFTAELAMEVACTIASTAAGKISIAIISPYRAQVRLLRKWIIQEQKADRTPYKNIEFESGTVHQFQGSDADVVIFDVVDGVGRSKLGNLLRGETGRRLVNVAITRAKGKFILLADKTWCERTFARDDNPILWELIMEREAVERLQVMPPPRSDDDIEKQREKLESPIEQILFEEILKHTELTKVVPQFLIRDEKGQPVSRADFAFPEIKYAIYCDGKQWHLKEDRWQRDLRQRNKLAELGWRFSVYSGSEINSNPHMCVEQITTTHQRLSSNGQG